MVNRPEPKRPPAGGGQYLIPGAVIPTVTSSVPPPPPPPPGGRPGSQYRELAAAITLLAGAVRELAHAVGGGRQESTPDGPPQTRAGFTGCPACGHRWERHSDQPMAGRSGGTFCSGTAHGSCQCTVPLPEVGDA